MEILHLGKYYPPDPGGIEYVVRSLLDATQGNLSHYCLVASRTGPSRIEHVPGGTVHYIKEQGTLLLAPILPSLPFLLHRLRKTGDFPIVLIHYPNPTASLALFLSLLGRRKREKIAVWYHADVLLEEWWKCLLYALFRPLEEFVFRRADAFVAATPHHISSSTTLSRYREKVTIIPFAVPDGWFDVLPSEESASESVREKLGGRYLLFVGRLVPYKGLDTLLAAAGEVDARIALIGTGPLEGHIRKEIAARGLQGKVTLLGNVADLRPYYLGCEFLVLPSNSALEAFGIVQIEAMALGKPVVSSNLPTGVTWVNRDGETGLTFHVGDAGAFAAACNRLLGDEALRTRLRDYARAWARVEFSQTALAGKAVSFFMNLVGQTIRNQRIPRGDQDTR